MGRGRGHGQRARPVVLPAGHVRYRGAAGALAARSARRGDARGVQPLRAAGGIGRGRAGLPGGAGRRRLRDHRHQGVDHRRRQRRLVHAVRPHRSRQPGGVLLPGAGGRRRPVVRSAGAQDGTAGGADDQRSLRRRAAARGPADRRRGAGAADRVQRAGLRAAGYRGRGDRAGPGGAGLRGRLRETAADVRPADHRPRGPGVPARGHGRRGGRGPGDLPGRGAPAGCRAPVQPAGQRGQAGRHRRRHEGDHRRRPGSR